VSVTTAAHDVYYDPYDRALTEDPYPAFKRLRDEAPIYYNEQYDFWAVSRFEDVERALVDNKTFRSNRGVILEMIQADFDMPPGTLIHDEGQLHTVHRSLLSRVFTPKRMGAIEPLVREFCAKRLDALMDQGGFDVVSDYAEYIPMWVFGTLLGIPEEEQEAVRLHVEAGMHAEPGKPQEYDTRGEDVFSSAFYAHFVDERYANPTDDIITKLISTEFEDVDGTRRVLRREEALTYLGVISGAGNHTTNRLITWTAKVLGDHPDQRREVHADRSLIPQTIEETLRFEPSSTQIARSVDHDVVVHGQVVPAGAAFLCLVGSADRDERAFGPDADQFDIHRKFGHHLSFGYGANFCLGASLARLEGRVALDEMLNRFRDWDVDHDNAVMGSSTGVRGYDHLPITIR
jgi:cytochrome P450